MPRKHIHFVTGKLAAPALHELLQQLGADGDFNYSIQILPITVAALMTPDWIARRLVTPPEASEVLLPGYCRGELKSLAEAAGVPVQHGPRDLRELPDFFGQPKIDDDFGAYDIEILAEINHAPQRSLDDILQTASRWAGQGANVIDVGCDPGAPWIDSDGTKKGRPIRGELRKERGGIGRCVRALRDAGHRVSVDSYQIPEIAAAVEAGAELVLSVNQTNRHAAVDWGCEVVAVPDDVASIEGLDETLNFLDARGVPYRIDPILEPIGFGFAASLLRYHEIRRRYPSAEMMMGIGNLTELTDCDSAGINLLLLAVCQELGVRSVLTTEVIPWAQSSVRECDVGRRLVHYAITHQTLPKHLSSQLVMLRDPRRFSHSSETIAQLAAEIRDNNFRILAEDDTIHLASRDLHLQNADPFLLFEQLQSMRPDRIDVSHAFYLGYEMAKAVTALTLSKQYRQDDALSWGLLSRPEERHRLRPVDRVRPNSREESHRPDGKDQED